MVNYARLCSIANIFIVLDPKSIQHIHMDKSIDLLKGRGGRDEGTCNQEDFIEFVTTHKQLQKSDSSRVMSPAMNFFQSSQPAHTPSNEETTVNKIFFNHNTKLHT